MRVLIIEDERRVGQFLRKGLEEASYSADWVRTCAEARDALCNSHYDAIVLDLTLPDGDGLQMLSEWRRGGFTEPILILSARDTREERVRGLNLGADDYLPKPFGFDELLARIRSILRRDAGVKATRLEHNGIQLDLVHRQVSVGERRVELTNREFALLELFMLNPGRVLTRTMIAEKVWEADYDIESNSIEVYMNKLRMKLASTESVLFKTIRGVGYQMI